MTTASHPRRLLRKTFSSVVAALVLAACVPGSTDGPAGFCGWIGADVDGLGQIVSEDGTQTVGTWYHVFAEGVTSADTPSRQAIAQTVAADRAGFERVHDEATETVQPALDRMYELIQNPADAQARRNDPAVQQDVDLIDAQGCDILRQTT